MRRPALVPAAAVATLLVLLGGGTLTASAAPSPVATPSASASASAASPPRVGALCDDGSGAWCGTVSVPRDYARPADGTISIAWKLYRNSRDPKLPTIGFVAGGPGDPGIAFGTENTQYVLGDLLTTRDVLYVDQRGEGTSEAVDCPEFQHATVPSRRDAVAACARQLGPRFDDYNSATNAKDYEKVRQTLKIDTFDLIGFSYGSMDSVAYAARYGSHVASIVMASGAGPAFQHLDARLPDLADVARRTQKGLCKASVRCAKELGDPLEQIAWAVRKLDAKPLTGRSSDPEGKDVDVTVTSATLARASMLGSATTTAWTAGAASAWRQGDPAPLLRLAAATDWENRFNDSGESADFSEGAGTAVYCADYVDKPWRPGLTTEQRLASERAKAAKIPASALFPFSTLSYLPKDPAGSLEGAYQTCSVWPDTAVEAPLPAGAKLPDVPVLALVGGYDSIVPQNETIADAKLFRRHQVVEAPTAGHVAPLYICGADVLAAFYHGYGKVPSTCGETDQWYVQPSFPQTAAGVSTATVKRRAGDASTARDRQVAEAVWRTDVDGFLQAWDRPDKTTSKGLRGGTIIDDGDDSSYWIDYDHYRFVSDVAITGRSRVAFTDDDTSSPFVATFTVDAGSGQSGELTVSANLDTARDGMVTITGTLGGRAVNLTTSSY